MKTQQLGDREERGTPMPLKRQPAANGKCQAKTKAGRSCAAPAIRGSRFCALHSDPNRAAELGRRGGGKHKHVYESDAKEVAAPQNAADVKAFLAETMAEIRGGRMDPKVGTTLGYLGTSLLKAIETSDIEQRLAKTGKLKWTASEPALADLSDKGPLAHARRRHSPKNASASPETSRRPSGGVPKWRLPQPCGVLFTGSGSIASTACSRHIAR